MATALTLFLAAMASQAAGQPPPITDSVPGLTAAADLIVDHWGIPHIFAANQHDAFFLQGWNAARDRLWQIDLWRKRGLGRLAASFGASFVEQDHGARLLLYRGDVNAIWDEFGAEAKADTEAFTAGVNAYVQAVLAGQRQLPVEFRITGSQPELWSAEDVVRMRSHGLVGNVTAEVQRAQVACAAGLDADKYRQLLQPSRTPKIPEGLDPCLIKPELLRLYLLGTDPVHFRPDGSREPEAGDIGARVAALAVNAVGEGSNNWAISAGRSATGRPVLANDPHRAYALPSLRYIAHLNAPGLDVIGAGEPGLPGISTGHNQRIAFGLTISEVDQEDLYVYDLDPHDPDRYRYGDGYETMRKLDEMIPVKGEAPRPVTLRFTRHGPVLAQDGALHAVALRSVWALPDAIPYFSALLYQKAGTWTDFVAALAHWGAPPLNQVYADVDGNIGWTIAAAAPLRPNWDGLLPVPGDGRYEWAGTLDPKLSPALYNPADGFIATANDFNLPSAFTRSHMLGYEWSSRSRIDRLREVLGGSGKLPFESSLGLQTDTTTSMARRFLAQLPATPPSDPQAAQAVALLRGWNARLDKDSAPALLYELWVGSTLPPAMLAELVPAPAVKLFDDADLEPLLAVLEAQPGYRVAPDLRRKLDEILLSSLVAAWQHAVQLEGPDPRFWSWGRIHHSMFNSAVKPMADPSLAWQLGLQSYPLGGSDYAPMAAAYDRHSFAVTEGASVRLVHDVGNWDNSRAINTPGQSGDPMSPFYSNLLPLWASGQSVPLLYSRAAIEKAAAQRYRLMPP